MQLFKQFRNGFSTLSRVSRPAMVLSRPLVQKKILFGLSMGLTSVFLNRAIRMDAQQDVQSTVITDCHPSCAMVVLKISPEWLQDKKLKEILNSVKGFKSIVSELGASEKTDPEDDLFPLMVGVGFNTNLWQSLGKGDQQHHKNHEGRHGVMPNSPSDIVLHVKGQTQSLCLEAVQSALRKLPKGSCTVVHEHYGYKYRDGRDLSGFLDGTMNTVTPTQRSQNGIVSSTGGSYMIHQVWRHDLNKLDAVSVDEQEKWVGRKKENSLEQKTLDVSSHVKRMRDSDGKRLLIVRQSMPYGIISGEHGLLFIAYTNVVDRFDVMLDQMVGIKDGVKDGNDDSIMKFSKCTFSNYFYFPSTKEVESL